MKLRSLCFLWLLLGTLCFLSACEDVQGQTGARRPYPDEEKSIIGRGLAVFPGDSGGRFLTWRRLPEDPDPPTYVIWRIDETSKGALPERIATTHQTHYADFDKLEDLHYSYSVGTEGQSAKPPVVAAVTGVSLTKGTGALVFDLETDYQVARVVTGDLTGNGELEFLIAYSKMRNVDPYEKAWHASTDSIKVAAFRSSGERIWTIDLGPGIESGGVYAPMVVWDIDADGRAEVLLKTNNSDNPRDYKSDRLTVLNGETGLLINEVPWPEIEGPWADNYGNNSRNYIAVAHLDGSSPTIIVARGLYKTQKLWAYDSALNFRWERIMGRHIHWPVKNKYLRKIWNLFAKDRTQGSHSLPVADVDEDGKEELLWGEHCIGENGKDEWVVKEGIPYRGQPDIVFAEDIYPDLPGKEVFYCREGAGRKREYIGVMVVDSAGRTLWSHWGYYHVDGGWVARVMPDEKGVQCFAYDIVDKNWEGEKVEHIGSMPYIWRSDGIILSNPPESWVRSIPVDWEGDGVKEICTEEGILEKYDGGLVREFGAGVLWAGDLYGDHREEIVHAPGGGKIYILSNTEPMASDSRITRLADRQYRNDLSRTAMQYNVIPTESGYLPKKGHE